MQSSKSEGKEGSMKQGASTGQKVISVKSRVWAFFELQVRHSMGGDEIRDAYEHEGGLRR